MPQVLVAIVGLVVLTVAELVLWRLGSRIVGRWRTSTRTATPTDGSAPQTTASGPRRKSPGLAVFLALCVPGLGHLYVRRVGLAIAFFIPIVICGLRLAHWAGMRLGDAWDKDAEHLTIVAIVALQIAQIVSAGVLAARHGEVSGSTR